MRDAIGRFGAGGGLCVMRSRMLLGNQLDIATARAGPHARHAAFLVVIGLERPHMHAKLQVARQQRHAAAQAWALRI